MLQLSVTAGNVSMVLRYKIKELFCRIQISLLRLTQNHITLYRTEELRDGVVGMLICQNILSLRNRLKQLLVFKLFSRFQITRFPCFLV